MKTNTYKYASALALAGLLAAAGCAKKEIDTPAPQASPAGSEPLLVQARQAWARFVGEVEGGRVRDRTGQYVSKATQVANGDGTAARPTRAKFDAAQLAAGAAAGGAARGAVGGVKDGGGGVANYLYPAPEDPICDDCPGGGGGGGYYPPPVYSTFASSEGVALNGDPVDNPNNYILNASIVKSDDVNVGARVGYNRLNIDLNRGAGGKYIYMCFTRQSSDYAENAPWDQAGGVPNGTNWIDKRPLTGFDAVSYSFAGTIQAYRPTNWDYVYQYTGLYPYYWKNPDLNDGAGGKYIHAIVSKGIPATIYQTPPTVPISNVGVIAGNSSSIQPPAGWYRSNQDLNEGAGGDYIYLCWHY